MRTMRILSALAGVLALYVCAAEQQLVRENLISKVEGRIARRGAADIKLNGTMVEGKIVGAASIGGSTSFFEAYRKLGALVVVLEETGAVTGQTVELRAEFFPASEENVTEQQGIDAAPSDPDLVGTWKTRTYEREGDMVLPVDSIMVLAADGDYAYEAQPVSASRQGRWRSQAGRLEYRAKDAVTWSVLGTYQVRGDKLIVIVPERDPQIWSRVTDKN